jgi:hypothetical protein
MKIFKKQIDSDYNDITLIAIKVCSVDIVRDMCKER